MFPARRIDDDSTGVRLGDLNDAGDVLRQFYLRASQAPVGSRRSRRNGLGLQGEWQRRNDRNSIGVSPQR
jgi:hypothetical protein